MRRTLAFIRNRRRKILLLLIDLFVLWVAALISATIVWGASVPWKLAIGYWGMMSLLLLLFMRLLKTNLNVWRFASSPEYLKLTNTYVFVCITAMGIDHLFLLRAPNEFFLYTVLAAALASIYCRILYTTIRNARIASSRSKLSKNGRRPLAIIGAGSAGVALSREIALNAASPFTTWGFFDDDPSKIGMNINGVPVLGNIASLTEHIKNSDVHDIVLAIPTLTLERRREVIHLCSSLNCKLKIVPEFVFSMETSQSRLSKSIRDVKVEDLLGRSSIQFRSNELTDFLRDKTVLVTGGGGSIGSELCRQIAGAGAKKLVIFDINENTSYLLAREIHQQISTNIEIVVEIGSMTDMPRVLDMFRSHKPDVAFHAAAHKHVPLMEHCPYEAVKNNILGTYNVITAASTMRVKKFVFISTDKAVNPTSVMGATKRYCENMMLALSRKNDNATCFVSVRFGNVLGSAGSVIPIFQEQIEHGGPVTVTDFRVTRYFMTIPEAVGLVLKSGSMASSSETYILDMGEPMRIVELAENLIRLCGMEPYRDIPIVEVGLRPGEKLYEELLVGDANHIATRESKIFIEKNDTAVDWQTITDQLKEFSAAASDTDNESALRLLHRFVPGYLDPEVVNRNAEARADWASSVPLREAVPVGNISDKAQGA